MSLDERIKHIAQQAIREATTTAPDSGLMAAVRELAFKLDAALARVDDVHEELHAVAGRVTALEPQHTPEAPRTRQARKATSE